MFKWCLFPMFVAYCVSFAIAAVIFGSKTLVLPAAEMIVLGTLVFAFNRAEKSCTQTKA